MKRKIKLILTFFIVFIFVSCSSDDSVKNDVNSSALKNLSAKDKASLSYALEIQNVLRRIAKEVSPAVVSIRASRSYSAKDIPENDNPLYKYFFGEKPPSDTKERILGSGFIITKNGLIVTNYHVVGSFQDIIVYLNNEKEYKAQIIGFDEHTDIALLKITGEKDFPCVNLGNSDIIEVGDFAVAIGNPFGLKSSFTLGVVSATGRREANIDINAAFKNYIQTDASINQGNSGGPLVNIIGEVIGMNAAIVSTSGGSIGIGFAIPINIIKSVAEELIKKGKVERGYIGVEIREITDELSSQLKLKRKKGVIIQTVEPNSPAEIAGLKPGDIILSINGVKIKSSADMIKIISDLNKGNNVEILVLRKSKKKTLRFMVTERPINK